MKQKYRFVFSVWGMAAFLLVMVPNILWAIFPPQTDPLAGNSSGVPFLNVLMSASQWIMVAMLIFLKSNKESKSKGLMITAGGCLLTYWFFWILYYLGCAAPIIFVSLAVFPCAFFALVALWLGNLPALLPLAVFAILHIGITVGNICV